MKPPSGRVIAGRYELVTPLAEGGMGTVWLARHLLTRTELALKILRNDVAHDDAFVERFLREVRFAAEIGHPGIVQVHDAGEDEDGSLYLAMELLRGHSLEALMEAKTTTSYEVMRWLFAALDPLAAAHARGIVHRDLKPDNFFLCKDSAGGKQFLKIIDFGIARQTGATSKTGDGTGLGTVHYMSPEQASNARDVTPAADVWAMGVMMYEAITGRVPFDGESAHEIVLRLYNDPHTPIRQIVPGVDPELARLIDECLSKDPKARPADAAALAIRLRALLERRDVAAALGITRPIAPPDHKALVHPPKARASLPPREYGDFRSSNVEAPEVEAQPTGDATERLRRDALLAAEANFNAGRAKRRKKSGGALWIGGAVILGIAIVASAFQLTSTNSPVAVQAPQTTTPEAASPAAAPAAITPEFRNTLLPPPPPYPQSSESTSVASGARPKLRPAAPRISRWNEPRRSGEASEVAVEAPSATVDAGAVREELARVEPVAAPAVAVVAPAPVVTPPPAPAAPRPEASPARVANRLSIASVDVRGDLRRAEMARTAERASSSYRQCFERAGITSPQTVRVSAEVDELGAFRNASARGAPASVSECIARETNRLRAARAPDTGHAGVSYEVALGY